MPITLAHLLAVFLCIVAAVREFPEFMAVFVQGFLALWVYRRFLR